MNVRRRILAVGAPLVLLVALGCGAPDEAPSPGVAADQSAQSGQDLAVLAAKAVRENPAAADSILSGFGLTRAGFDALMYDVAADAERSRAYAEAMR